MITKGDYVRVKSSVNKSKYSIPLPGTEWLVIAVAENDLRVENNDLYPGGPLYLPLEDVEPCLQAHKTNMTLPVDSTDRKNYPLFRGCLRYFPAALAGVSKTSKLGNDKHNPNEEMHHARSKSSDQGDCIIRHLIDTEDLLAKFERGESVPTEDILNEVNQMAWRALAFSQEIHERFGAPMAPGAKK